MRAEVKHKPKAEFSRGELLTIIAVSFAAGLFIGIIGAFWTTVGR